MTLPGAYPRKRATIAQGVVGAFIGAPEPKRLGAAAARFLQQAQLAGADVVDDAVQREAALRDGLLDGGVLLEDVDGGLDVELGEADGARVVGGQFF